MKKIPLRTKATKLVIHKNGKTFLYQNGSYLQKRQSYPSHGYPSVWFRSKSYLVHRLVATGYIPNPTNQREVNHINGNKSDARSLNLEWCSYSDNLNHSYKILGRRSRLNGGKGSIYWDSFGNCWKAAFHKNRKILRKGSKSRAVCEKWLENLRNGH